MSDDDYLEQTVAKYQREIGAQSWNHEQILDVFARAAIYSDDDHRRYAYIAGVFGVTDESLAEPIANARARRERLDVERRTRRPNKQP
ncbi:hypothetical protein [Mycobacteroides abscessus]|uniref:hypothetical protein n=1 Tax=Mycobacteroides abscessus TaxID=36809 RepID=UPI0009A6D812|nr:hypothetical protein [Mycobacteroides abscessus]SLJ71046.1 Uncharacterised protein [Mycobacteroides abscessus subsp. abscessus]